MMRAERLSSLCWEQQARWICLVDRSGEAVMDEIPGWPHAGEETERADNTRQTHILIIIRTLRPDISLTRLQEV